MSVTCGFYNSLNHDRVYDALQISSIFDGIISDGIYDNVGHSLIVRAGSGMGIIVGSGRAWFHHTWTLNDADMPIMVAESEAILKRIDAVVLKIDATETVRANTIEIIKGVPASIPSKPELIDTDTVFYYPLAYITVGAGVSEIRQSDIENAVGLDRTPFVTGILEHLSVEEMVLQWTDKWERWSKEQEEKFTDWAEREQSVYRSWVQNMTDEFESWSSGFRQAEEADFIQWFQSIRDILDTDAAGHLQNEIDQIVEREFQRFYGLTAKTTKFNRDEDDHVTSIVETTDEMVATTTFLEDNTRIVTELVPADGNWDYIKTVLIDREQNQITESYERRAK